jgi:hypothetical protein
MPNESRLNYRFRNPELKRRLLQYAESKGITAAEALDEFIEKELAPADTEAGSDNPEQLQLRIMNLTRKARRLWKPESNKRVRAVRQVLLQAYPEHLYDGVGIQGRPMKYGHWQKIRDSAIRDSSTATCPWRKVTDSTEEELLNQPIALGDILETCKLTEEVQGLVAEIASEQKRLKEMLGIKDEGPVAVSVGKESVKDKALIADAKKQTQQAYELCEKIDKAAESGGGRMGSQFGFMKLPTTKLQELKVEAARQWPPVDLDFLLSHGWRFYASIPPEPVYAYGLCNHGGFGEFSQKFQAASKEMLQVLELAERPENQRLRQVGVELVQKYYDRFEVYVDIWRGVPERVREAKDPFTKEAESARALCQNLEGTYHVFREHVRHLHDYLRYPRRERFEVSGPKIEAQPEPEAPEEEDLERELETDELSGLNLIGKSDSA